MKVYKFGGASVRNANGVRNLLNIVRDENELFVIVSAMGKTTNALERVFDAFRQNDLASCRKEIDDCEAYHAAIIDDLFCAEGYRLAEVDNLFHELRALCEREHFEAAKAEAWYDRMVSFGELISTTIVAAYLNRGGIVARWLDMRDCLLTQPRHKDANVLLEASAPLLRRAIAGSAERIFIGQGFIGSAPNGETTTLGREGSDYSAAVVANILDAESMTVWKDVDGILNADPKIFPEARKIDSLGYVDTIELAYSGAQIIHPKTIKPLQNKHIPLYVRPFGDKSLPGTVINDEATTVSAPIIILKRDQSLLRLRSRDLSFVLEEKFPIVFSTLERFRIKTNLIHNTAVELALCVERNWHLEEAAEALRGEGFDTVIDDDIELLTVQHCDEASRNKYLDPATAVICQTTPETLRIVRRRG